MSDLTKYDDLNVDRFKVMIEFIEYDRTYRQQLVEKADSDYWDGLVNEAALASQASGHLTDSSAQVIERYNRAITRYYEAGEVAGNNDYAKQNAVGAANATEAASLQYPPQIAANTSASQSHTAKHKYEQQARVHQVARQDITREVIGIKLNELRRGGGALNYNDRMREIGGRALNDFLEVSARLHAIALGLREFYFITEPSDTDLEKDMTSARTRIEGALKWLRKAANALARARMDEQECVVRLTVEPRAGGTLLEELKKGLIVPVSADLVPENARLRGISATAEQADGDTWIDLEVTSPEQKLPYAGLTLPSVAARLGRVSSSTSLNVRDIAGGRPIINRAPVGNWTLRAIRDDRGQQISRLHLDFYLLFC